MWSNEMPSLTHQKVLLMCQRLWLQQHSRVEATAELKKAEAVPLDTIGNMQC